MSISGNQRGSSNLQNSIFIRSFTTVDHESDSFKYWVAGFIEGEGGFSVSFKPSAQVRMGFQVCPEISITQHVSRKAILEKIKALFNNVGSPIILKTGTNVCVYKITKVSELLNVVIPFLLKYNCYSGRMAALNTLIFVCESMQKNSHLNVEGLRLIVERVFDTPLDKGNRQLKKEELLAILGNQQKAADFIRQRREKVARDDE